MNRLLPTLAITVLTGGLLLSNPISAQFVRSAKKAAHVRILKGPELESATENLTIIRWTSDNPGGSPEHFGVVHYGTDPKNLSQTAKSHIRLNPTDRKSTRLNSSHLGISYAVFCLKKKTTFINV